MKHGEHTVEMAVAAAAEKSVGGVWAESKYFVFARFGYCGAYNFGFFGAEHTLFAGMRV